MHCSLAHYKDQRGIETKLVPLCTCEEKSVSDSETTDENVLILLVVVAALFPKTLSLLQSVQHCGCRVMVVVVVGRERGGW